MGEDKTNLQRIFLVSPANPARTCKIQYLTLRFPNSLCLSFPHYLFHVCLTCEKVLLTEGERLTNPAVSEEAEAVREDAAVLLAVIDILQVDLGGELVPLHHLVGLDRAGVGTPEDLDPHTDGARVFAVRQEPHLAGHQGGLQALA